MAGAPTPRFLYGTAWKEAETERCTAAALAAGFRGIDTANQRKHYDEAGVGAAVAGALSSGLVTRDQLFLQTKFTSRSGQDHRLPYDANADPETQVHQSFDRSLEHLQVATIDSYVLHGPSTYVGWADEDLAVWRAMEALQAAGRIRFIGVSNVGLGQLAELCARARTPPAFVQNRCYARTGWDREVRACCRANGIVYQGFSLLTANQAYLRNPRLLAIARRTGWTPAQVVFRFALDVGMLPLTGTTDPAHLAEDLAILEGVLADQDVQVIEGIAG
jgi:diketogulonate reductase-like aldo/keto reductase